MKIKFKYSDEDYNAKLKAQDLIGQDFFEGAFGYWFTDRDGFRSPFPEYMRHELRENVVRVFMEWTFTLAESDINSDALSNRFTRILNEIAMQLTKTEDDAVSILHPQAPRVGDLINVKRGGDEGTGTVLSRKVVEKGSGKILQVKCKMQAGDEFESELELS